MKWWHWLILERLIIFGVMTGKQVYKQRKKFEKLLQKMLDKKIIKSWFYNGEYHIAFNEFH